MNSNVLCFLNYNLNYKRFGLTIYINAEIATYGDFENNLFPEIDKMFQVIAANSVVVTDPRTSQMTQILEWLLDKRPRIKWSEYEKTVNFVCYGPAGHCLSKYVVSCEIH